MKRVLLLIILVAITGLFAQSDFEAWMEQQNQQFDNWKSQQDKEFSQFLEKGWSYYETESSAELDENPKPENIPNPVDQSCPDLIVGEIVDIAIDLEELKPPEIATIEEEVQNEQIMYAVSKGNETLKFEHWGLKFYLNYNKNMQIEALTTFSSSTIASFWSKISNTDFEVIHKDLLKMKDKFILNDWAFCQLIYRAGNEIYKDPNMANLFTWFILTKSGYDSKVGYNEEEVYLLLATRNNIYGNPHLKLEEKDYYALDLGDRQSQPLNMYTYEGSYPDANDLIDLSIESSPYFDEVLVERKLSFSYLDSMYTIVVQQNQTLVEFLSEYPATDLSVYFESEISPQLKKSLLEGLIPILENRTETEALNIILRFVQTAFEYQTDDQQFGVENSLFPDETIYYDYCDCEDRSFLFSYLVKELLELKVIGLDYPGHIATAVEMKEAISGDKITYNGVEYLICDPTYINADIGVVMPQFADANPEIIQIR